MRIKKVLIKLIYIFSITSIFFVSNISNAGDLKWNLYFDNIEITPGSVSANQEATIIGASRAEITFDVTLGVPGDFYEFTVDAVNGGTVDAMINQIGVNTLTETQKKYLSYNVTYSDGIQVKVNDLLKAGTTEKFRVRLTFKDDVSPIDLPSESTSMTLVLNTSYVQADENAVERERNTIDNSNVVNNTIDDSNIVNNTNSNDDSNAINNTNTDNTINETNIDNDNTITNNIDNSTDEKKSNPIITRILNPKTGDEIFKHVIILILSAIALIVLYKKNDDK